METYAIPAQNLPELRQKIERLDRRARKLGSAPIGLLVKRSYFEERVVDMRTRAIKFYEVAISGETPKLAGWEFLARINTAQRVIFSVPGADALPERFRDTENRCDHCGTRRQRKAVFVVRHETSGEFKQVGRNCLRDFLGHQNPDEISRWTQKWVEAFAAHSALAQVVRAEAQVVEDARNILHAHNRPEPQRLPNEQRIAARGLLEGAARRLRDALEAARP